MSRKVDPHKNNEYDDELDYGERLHREKTRKVKRGKSKYFDDYEYQPPRKAKPLRRNNATY